MKTIAIDAATTAAFTAVGASGANAFRAALCPFTSPSLTA
jgi:hypothetical protein